MIRSGLAGGSDIAQGRTTQRKYGIYGGAWFVVALVSCLCVHADVAEPTTATPQQLFKDLFVAVAAAQIFDDGKAFVDAVPNSTPAEILARYHEQKPSSPAALKSFVAAHFVLPSNAATTSLASGQPLGTHIDSLWDQLTRNSTSAPPYASLLPLPAPYVVPGGRFREMFYWDSYFTLLGLAESGRTDLVQAMVRNFAYLIDTYGHVPNGTRSYFLSRSQPPFFFAMVGLLSPADPAQAFADYLPQLKKEYAFWMEGANELRPGKAQRRVVALADGSILNRYWDDLALPRDESYREDVAVARAAKRDTQQVYRDLRASAESGWDFSSRWFADAHTLASIVTTEIAPIDLNSLLFGLENAIRDGCQRAADQACVNDFAQRAQVRKAAINRYLWDAAGGAFFDY